MTSRERTLAAVNHKKVDRLPANFSAKPDVITRLIEKTGLADEEELLKFLGIDMKRIPADYHLPDTGPEPDDYYRTMWGVRYKKTHAGVSYGHIFPFNESSILSDVHEHTWPDANRLDYSSIKDKCKNCHRDFITFGSPWSPFFHEIGWMVGQENFYVWMHTKPEIVKAVIGHIVDFEIEATRRFLEATKGFLDFTYFGNDFGTQRGLFISRACFEEFIRKPLKRFYDISHDYGCKVMQHSCGSIRDILPLLIEDGVDIIDPIQVSSKGMSLFSLDEEFGNRLVFHGGVCTQTLLPFASVKEVRNQVCEYINHFKNKGGYILTGSQELIEDIPVDNILAMYEENQK